jgi:hypothetical protein
MPEPMTFGAGDAIVEKSDAQYECVFKEAAPGQPQLLLAAITGLTATLKNVGEAPAVINSRNAQSVLNANGGTLVTDGTFTLMLSALDNIYVGTQPGGLEQHRLTLRVTFTRTGGGTGTLNHEVLFWVRNLVDVP